MNAEKALATFRELLHDIVDHLPVKTEQKTRQMHDTIDQALADDLDETPATPAGDVPPASPPAVPAPITVGDVVPPTPQATVTTDTTNETSA